MRHYLLFIVLVLTPVTLFAQNTGTQLENSKVTNNDTVYTDNGPVIVHKTYKVSVSDPTTFTDSWFVTASIGPHFYRGENEWKMKLHHEMAPSLDISVGNWVTSCLGFDLVASFAKFKGAWSPRYSKNSNNVSFITYQPYTDSHNRPGEPLYYQKGSMLNAYIRVLLDLSTLGGMNRSDVKNHFIPFAGFGFATGLGDDAGSNAHSYTFNAGLMFDHRFNDHWSFIATGHAALLDDMFDGENSTDWTCDGKFGLTAGVAYRFGKAKVTSATYHKPTPVPVPAPAPAVQPAPAPVVVAAPVNIQSEREKLEKQREEIIGMLFPYYSHFTIDDTTLVNREKVNLAVVAKFMNDNPKMKFVVSGYADMQTGTIARNKWLAENRAKRVVQVLVNEFMVDPKQLILESYGGVGNMFYNENQLSRCVIITIKE